MKTNKISEHAISSWQALGESIEKYLNFFGFLSRCIIAGPDFCHVLSYKCLVDLIAS